MNQYEQMYQDKRVTMDEALSFIRDGDVIGTSQCANEPTAIFDALPRLKGKVRCKFFAPMCFNQHAFFSDPEFLADFETDITFLMGAARAAHDRGRVGYYPGDLHNGAGRWIETNGCTVFITAATSMDRHGYLHIPLCLIHERAFLEAADRVIVQVNPNLPVTYGDTELHIRDVTCLVEAATPIPMLARSQPGEVEMEIGRNVASLVRDGDTIQLGIGGIPDAAALSLMDKHDLGVHSEMLTNSMVDLVEAGVITGRKKTLHPGKLIGTFAYGDQRLYDMIDRNSAVRILRGEYVNDPWVVSRNDNFISINSALQIDLTGQICSESIGSRQYSGSGGQTDMAIGAAHARGGRNVIAVASTKKGGTISTIMPTLAPGSVVTLSRNEIDFVVTEYGIARLRGLSVRERVKNLIAVAHPDFRAELKKEADRLLLV